MTLARWGGVAGLGYVAAVIVGNVVAGSADEGSAADSRLLAFYNDSTNQWRAHIGALVIGVAALAFIAYLFALCDRLASSGDSWPGLVRVAFASGVAFVVVDELGVAIGSAVPATLVYSDELSEIRDAELVRVTLVLGKHWLSGLASVFAA